MKTATKNLEDDHVYIIKLTEVMRAVTSTAVPDIEHIESIVDIIKNFADGLHHAKEENILFPAMERKGFSAQQGPVAVMLHEHLEGRNFVKGIAENLYSFKQGDKSVVNEIYSNMKGYADLLLNHISKENNILFRMADKAFSEDEQRNLLDQFEKIEQNRADGTLVRDYIKRINELASIYKVS